MKNKQIAEIFNRMGALLEMKDENVFRVRSYYKAAENIANLAEDIATLREEGRLGEIAGIGKTLEEKIIEYLDTGRMTAYETLTAEIPESLLELIKIPSVGPKKAKLFYQQLKIANVAGLKKAAEEGRLLTLPGIKEKTVENILSGIKIVQAGQERMDLGAATAAAEPILSALRALPEVKMIEAAGSLRRGKETVRDIDILVDSSNPEKVMDVFVRLPQVKAVNVHGDTKSSILTHDNVQVDLRVVEPQSFGAALLYFTGSTGFNVKLRQIAIKKNMKVNEYGIFSVQGDRETLIAAKTEKECLSALGLPFIPPELREDMGESRLFPAQGDVKIPRLVDLKDIKGEVHVHSTWSDGHHAIAEMAEAARARGYGYLAVSDHSERLKVAGGISREDLKKKKAEIDRLNETYRDFRVLFGSEVEIDSEGNLDYNDAILSEFDIVIASIHSGFEQSREKITQRLIKACRNKCVNIIGHPTGVHLGRREPYDLDFKALCRAAAESNTFLEINAFPIRLDLNSSNVYFAAGQGVQFVINTDSHHRDHLDYMKFGVGIARRGWLTKEQVLNTLPLKEFLKRIKK